MPSRSSCSRSDGGEPSRARCETQTGWPTVDGPFARQPSAIWDRSRTRSGDGVRVEGDRRLALDDVIDQAVLPGLLGRHEAVAVGVFLEPFQGLAGVLLVDPIQLLLHPE